MYLFGFVELWSNVSDQGEEMLHVDVDVPYMESFLGLTSSLPLSCLG